MEGTFFIITDEKNTEQENIVYIGEKSEYKTLESYLRIKNEEFIYDFTKNHLNKRYFSDEDCFISFLHKNPLQLRLQEPLIPKNSIVIIDEDVDIEDAILNKFQYTEEDYNIFSGEKIPDNINYTEEIFSKIEMLVYVLYQMLDAGYLVDENRRKVDDWIVTFQEPILDIFIRYHRLETSAPDMTTADEFLINPEFRKTICVMLMKIISNFIVNNEIIKLEDIEDFDSWMNEDLWYSIRESFKNES